MERRRLVIRVVLAVAVVAVVYVGLLPKLVDLGQVGATLRAMTWLELATLLAAAVWNLVSYLLPQLAALPGPRFGQAVLESHASTAVLNLLPAGQLALADGGRAGVPGAHLRPADPHRRAHLVAVAPGRVVSVVGPAAGLRGARVGSEEAAGAGTATAPDASTPAAPDRPVTRGLPDPRLVELLVCATALAGARLAGRLALPVAVLAGVVAAHGLVLARWPARRAVRLAWFGLMLVLLGILPAVRYVQATDRGVATLGHDGGVHVSDEAVRVLLSGRDPYQASYARVLADWRIDVQGRPAPNPLAAHYPYWPGSLALLAAVEGPLRAAGGDPDPRVLYLLVWCLVGLWLAAWSLRARGHLGLALAVCLNPLLLPYMWQGVNDVLLVAGLAVAAVALARGRVVLAGLAIGAAVSVKLLVAPVAWLFLVWLVAKVRRGRLDRAAAWRAAAATAAPAVVAALPFLAWHPRDFLTDAVGYHLGLVADAYPIAGHGLPALLLRAGVLHDPFGPSPLWTTTLPALAVLAGGTWWVWTRPGRRTLWCVSGLVLLGVLFFHRSFMFYYVDVPATALLLAALVRPPAAASAPRPARARTP